MGPTKVLAETIGIEWKTDWLPLFGALGGMSFINVNIQYAKYFYAGNALQLSLVAEGETSGTASETITFTLPDTQIFTLPITNAVDSAAHVSISEDNGLTWVAGVGRLQNTVIEISKYNYADFVIGSGILISCSTIYEIEPPY